MMSHKRTMCDFIKISWNKFESEDNANHIYCIVSKFVFLPHHLQWNWIEQAIVLYKVKFETSRILYNIRFVVQIVISISW